MSDVCVADCHVPKDRPWQKTYEEYGLDPNFRLPSHLGSLVDFFYEMFANHADKVAMTFMDKKMTYRELDTASLKIAAYLQSLGLTKGDKVAVMMPNCLQYPICMVGIIRAGCTLVNINPLYTASELQHQLKDSDSKALFIIENFAHTFASVEDKGQVSHVVVASIGDLLGLKGHLVNAVVRHIKKMVPKYQLDGAVSFKEALNAVSASRYERPAPNLDDVAVLQYTGGTTGVAKGAMLSHKNLLANVEQCMTYIEKVFGRDAGGEVLAVALPMYHIFCFTVSMVGLKMGFNLLLIVNARDFNALTRDFDKYRPAFFPAVNTLFNALTNHDGFKGLDHSNLKLSLGGGMSVLPTTAKNWEKLTGSSIIEGYGLSETAPVLVLNPPGGYTGKIGIPIPATDVVLLDEDGKEVALGEAGEICARGPQVMLGYYKRDDETAESSINGYFKTGDIGVMDERGFIKIVDRKKDMILVSGFNVYPNEVEEVIANHPKVLECGAIGVSDEHSGELVKVFVVKKDDSLTSDEIKQWAKEHLTGYKRPKFVEFLTELPKSNVGKILRKELRKIEEDKH